MYSKQHVKRFPEIQPLDGVYFPRRLRTSRFSLYHAFASGDHYIPSHHARGPAANLITAYSLPWIVIPGRKLSGPGKLQAFPCLFPMALPRGCLPLFLFFAEPDHTKPLRTQTASAPADERKWADLRTPAKPRALSMWAVLPQARCIISASKC